MSSQAHRATRPWTAAVGSVCLLAGLSTIPAVAQPQPGNVPPPPTADFPGARAPAANGPTANPPEANTPDSGRPNAGYLGIVGNDQQENGAGIRIIEIETQGPAENGGLKEDDLITKVNGTTVHSTADMGKIVAPLAAGSRVTFEVDRAGKKQTVQVTLGKRPPHDQRRFAQFGRVPEEADQQSPEGQPGAGPASRGSGALAPSAGGPSLSGPSGNVPTGNAPSDNAPSDNGRSAGPVPFGQPLPGTAPPRRQLLGVRTQPVTEEIRRRLALPVANGAWVVSRTLGSAAEKAGIPLDAVITSVNKTPIASPQDLARQVSLAGAGHAIELTYFSQGEYHRTNVMLADIAGQAPIAGQGPALAPRDVPAELPLPTPPDLATPPSSVAAPLPPQGDPNSQPFPPKSVQAQIQEMQRHLDELDARVHELEQAQRKQ